MEKLEIHEPRCLKCGKPIRCEEREFCHDCYNTEHIYERGVSVWLHKPPVNQAIYRLKYHNQRYVAKYFAQEICIKYAEEIRRWRPQVLVPVPLHRKRRRKRGYNQAELLAEEIGKILGIPVVANLVNGSLHWLSEKAGSHREKKESGTCICSGRRSGQTSDRFSTCHYYR